ARPAEKARALASRLDRSGARDRPPRLGSARPAHRRHRAIRRRDDLHLEPRAWPFHHADAVLRRPHSRLTLRLDGALLGSAVVIIAKIIAKIIPRLPMSIPATPLNRLRQLWREGRPAFGAIATIPSIQTVQIMARSGIDWIIVDLEHGPIDLGSAHAMITATSGTPCVPMVRIAANGPGLPQAP